MKSFGKRNIPGKTEILKPFGNLITAVKNRLDSKSGREYIIALTKWNSRLALLACLVTMFCSLYAVALAIVYYMKIGDDPRDLFHYFTINSNFLTAFSASLIVPFAVEGIRNKHFSYPRWIAKFHYAGTVCTTLTMLAAVGVISQVDPEMAFGRYNLYLHIICPVMVLISFFLVESGQQYSRKDALCTVIPTLIYSVIYGYEVLIVGKANGGWKDMYHVTEFVPVPVAFLLVLVLALGIALLIRWLYNKVIVIRGRRMEKRLWPKDVDPVEINIEIFGLGRYMGRHSDREFIKLPLYLIQMIADRYGISTEDLTKPYMRGFMDSLKDKNRL